MHRSGFAIHLILLTTSLLIGLSGPKVSAQSRDSLLTVYDTQTIHSFGSIYIKGSKRLTFRELSGQFEQGVTKDLYEKSRKSLALGRLLTVVSVAALVSSAILRKNQQTGGFALLAVGVGFNIGSLGLRKKSTELVDRALWQRNKEILFNVR